MYTRGPVASVVLTVAVVSLPGTAAAGLFISEIMYDALGSDTGTEWVEVYNDGTMAVELSQLRLADSKGAHKIVAASGGSMLAPGGRAIIARDPSAVTAPVPVFKSAMSLGNTSGTVELRSASGTLDTATYGKVMGAAGDGNTLNRSTSGATFTSRSPSPGATMSAHAIEKPAPTGASKSVPKSTSKKAPRTQAGAGQGQGAVTRTAVIEGERAAGGDVGAYASSSVQHAAAGQVSYEWPLAAGAITLLAGIGVAAARRVKRDEWTIIDDTPESA